MTVWTRWLALAVLATASVWWLSGCSGTTDKKDAAKGGDHKEGDHKKGDEHKGGQHAAGDHDDKPLTEKDVVMPASFKAGVARLEVLNDKIGHHIEHGGLAKVHRVAEEMALVAKKMKELAQNDVAEASRAEAGRLCNEVAGYYKPIDEAADAGKKAETEAVHKKLGAAIAQLKGLAK